MKHKKLKFNINDILYVCESTITDKYKDDIDDTEWTDCRSYFKVGAMVKIIKHPRTGEFYKIAQNGYKLYFITSIENPIGAAYGESYRKHLNKCKRVGCNVDADTYVFQNWIHESCLSNSKQTEN